MNYEVLRVLLTRPGLVSLLLLASYTFAVPAHAQRAEYSALVRATNEAETAGKDVERAKQRLAAHKKLHDDTLQGQDPYTTGHRQWIERWRAADARHRTVLGAAERALAEKVSAVEKRRDEFQAACEPYERLRREAVAAHKAIRGGAKSESNRRRALYVIERDLRLPNLQPVGFYIVVIDQFIEGMKLGQPSGLIESRLLAHAENEDHKRFISALMATVSELESATAPERTQKIANRFGKAATAAKVLKLFLADRSTDPFSSPEMEQFISIVSLVNDLIPSDLPVPVYKLLQIELEILQVINTHVGRLLGSIAGNNLNILKLRALSEPEEVTAAAWGLNDKAIFGRIPPVASLSVERSSYRAGEEITIRWESEPLAANRLAWIGIVPAWVPHADETLADRYDEDYRHIRGQGGEWKVAAPSKHRRWTVRMYDSDDAGNEVASVDFTVADAEIPRTAFKVFDEIERQPSAHFKQLFGAVPGLRIVNKEQWDEFPYRLYRPTRLRVARSMGDKWVLAGNPDATAGVRVDNFLLVEVAAWGRVSRFVSGAHGGVERNGIRLKEVGTGLSMPPLDISGEMPLGDVELTITPLDYGGWGSAQPLYLVVFPGGQ